MMLVSGFRLSYWGFSFNLVGIVASVVILFWAVVAIFAPLLTPYPIGLIVDYDYFGPMTSEFWLGTDYLGRDMLSRVLYLSLIHI